MQRPPPRLTLVRDPGPGLARAEPGEPRDVAVTAMLLGVSLLPILGELARVGRWGAPSVGFATAVAMLSGRELWHQLVDARG